jgi:hypothetical protein
LLLDAFNNPIAQSPFTRALIAAAIFMELRQQRPDHPAGSETLAWRSRDRRALGYRQAEEGACKPLAAPVAICVSSLAMKRRSSSRRTVCTRSIPSARRPSFILPA